MVILTCVIDRKLGRLKTSGYYGPVLRRVMIVFALLVVLLGAGCGGSEPSKQEFATSIVAARNDTDAGLAQIVDASSWEDLMARMKVAAVTCAAPPVTFARPTHPAG